ncbi:MAG: hypothetical protein RBS35_05665 [Azonexus sp.]|jgi:hypothetical protein|nr:hypothetical protein [Azonexus sp.]
MELIYLFLIVFVIFYLKNRVRQKSSPETNIQQVGEIEGDGDFEQEVVGESNYQKDLRQILKRLGSRRVCKALLYLEDENKYDSQAVCVFVDKRRVGYLSRVDAREFRKDLKAKGIVSGGYSCNAKLFGGTKEKPSIGVWLDIRK